MSETRDLIKYKSSKGLVETTDDEVDRPLHRRPGFEGIVSFKEMDERLAAFLRKAREDEKLTRADFATIVGLSTAVYGRYERAFSRMTVTRMIHLCEPLGFQPIDMLFAVAPNAGGSERSPRALTPYTGPSTRGCEKPYRHCRTDDAGGPDGKKVIALMGIEPVTAILTA